MFSIFSMWRMNRYLSSTPSVDLSLSAGHLYMPGSISGDDVAHLIVGPHFLELAFQACGVIDRDRVYAARAARHFCQVGILCGESRRTPMIS